MARWQTDSFPYIVDFAPEKLDEIRIAVVEGFYAVPRGGVEIGGVLYGKRSASRLLITDYRKIETEYLNGPSFHLSENDLVKLRRLIAFTKFDDPHIWPLGWYVSRTRSGIALSENDLALYRDFFRDPWQVTLVLKPDKNGKVSAGYFHRISGGAVKADSSALEFPVEPFHGAAPELADVEDAVSHGNAPEPSTEEEDVQPSRPVEEAGEPPKLPLAKLGWLAAVAAIVLLALTYLIYIYVFK